MNIRILSRRNPEDISMLRDIMYEMYGHIPYVKYVMRKFHNATVYIQGDTMFGLSIWRSVTRDISKEIAPEQYIQVFVLNTQQGDFNLVASMIRDIEMFGAQRGFSSILISPRMQGEEGFYQYLGFQIVSVFPSISMLKSI